MNFIMHDYDDDPCPRLLSRPEPEEREINSI
jgi:hypothetical protein